MRVVKAHAFGNDFLLVEQSEIADGIDRSALARELCERHRGLGADGLIVSVPSPPAPVSAWTS
jgi:diaminopimelate epimerase